MAITHGLEINTTTKDLDWPDLVDNPKLHWYTRILLLYGASALLVLGIPGRYLAQLGNILTITIMYTRCLKDRSLNFYLSTLCTFNFIILFFRVPRFLLEYLFGYDLADYSYKVCLSVMWVDLTLVSITTWHVTVLSVCKLVYALCRPKSTGSSKIHMMIVIYVCLVLGTLNTSFIYIGLAKTITKNNKFYCRISTHSWIFWFEAIVSTFLPVSLLLVCDVILLCLGVFLKRKTMRYCLGAQGVRKRFILVVFITTFLLIVTTTPVKLVENFKDQLFKSRSEAKFYLTISKLLLFFCNAVNFHLYCFLEKRLRSQIRLIFFPCCDYLCCCEYLEQAMNPNIQSGKIKYMSPTFLRDSLISNTSAMMK